MYVCIYIILYLATMLDCSSKHQKEFDVDSNPEQHLSVSCIIYVLLLLKYLQGYM